MGGKFRTESCDCLVAGGGTAGVIAAIQAGRAGADVILTEMNPLPGGTTFCLPQRILLCPDQRKLRQFDC